MRVNDNWHIEYGTACSDEIYMKTEFLKALGNHFLELEETELLDKRTISKLNMVKDYI